MDDSELRVQELAIDFVALAGEYIFGFDFSRVGANTIMRRFIAHFGVTPRLCAYVWIYTEERVLMIDKNAKMKHLLWLLNLLKTGDTEHAMNGRWCADEKTIRKWVYIFLEVVGDLGVVSTCG